MSESNQHRLLIVGDNASGRRLYESFLQVAPHHYAWLGVVADNSATPGLGMLLGPTHELTRIVSQLQPTDLILAVDRPSLALTRTLLQIAGGGTRLIDARTVHEEITNRFPVLGDDGAWFAVLGRLAGQRRGTGAAKRALDLLAGSCAMLALATIVVPVALALKLEGAGSVFVSERRIGRFGQPFTLMRFRTARAGPTSRRWPFDDPPAPMRAGRIIRRLGIDRLPQALAILAGYLSLVGPRPSTPEALELLGRESPMFLLRTAVKPGLVGWEQLHGEGRSLYDTLRPLEYDLYYIKHQSFALDLKILARAALAFLGLHRQAL